MSELQKKTDILVVDDDPATLQLFKFILTRDDYAITTAASAEEAVRRLKEKYFPVVVSDINLGQWDGLALIPYTKQAQGPCFIVFLTGVGSMETAVKAMQEGAFDYLCKPFNLTEIEQELHSVVARALKEIERVEGGMQAAPAGSEPPHHSLIGKSAGMVAVYRMIGRASLSRANALIIGESGTGKELVARAIHNSSARAKKEFVAVNCCALTETLFESELFGHVKGSFTGAIANKKGLFEVADGGTLFLDEIGDLSLGMQVKLLRALQEGEIKPVGATATRMVDVRIIAATHRDLKAYIEEGKFREDLYYRLKVFLIELPPLRERKDDIPELARYFITKTNQELGKSVRGLHESAMRLLTSYPWPGNIREMQNAIERAVSMTSTSELLPEDFPKEIQNVERDSDVAAPEVPPELTLEAMERQHIRKVLKIAGYSKSKAAELLGIDRTTLYRKASRYGIPLDSEQNLATG